MILFHVTGGYRRTAVGIIEAIATLATSSGDGNIRYRPDNMNAGYCMPGLRADGTV